MLSSLSKKIEFEKVNLFDESIDASGSLPESSWYGKTLYKHSIRQNGVLKKFLLVNFADPGQTRAEYKVLHEGIEVP